DLNCDLKSGPYNTGKKAYNDVPGNLPNKKLDYASHITNNVLPFVVIRMENILVDEIATMNQFISDNRNNTIMRALTSIKVHQYSQMLIELHTLDSEINQIRSQTNPHDVK